jgi:small-conductance mechanosensitive channel
MQRGLQAAYNSSAATPKTQSVMKSFETHLEEFLPKLIAALPAALAVIVGAIIVNFAFGRLMKLFAVKAHFTDKEVAPFRRIVQMAVFATSIVLILEIFGINLGGVWAMLSTMLAIVGVGFVASWSMLSNSFCTFMILMFRPFAIGDEIEFAGEPVYGKVIDLNFLYTTLRCDDGSDMQIPNNFFFQKVLKRRHGGGSISLTTQLNSRTPAQL